VPKGASLVPLDAALALPGQSANPRTHICHRLKSERSETPGWGRIALHLHMHYIDKAEFFCARLQSFNQPIDLFVTITDAAKLPVVDAAFKNYTRGRVHISAGPNRGRDIGPLLTALAEPLREGNYALVGHLHAKESKDIASGVGDRWRDYLLNHLLSTPGEIAHIFNLFKRNPKLGLLFAEDRHCVGWTKNKPKADALRQRLGLEQELPAHPIFPLGNMFWARPAVLEPLFKLDLQWSDYPPEPLPYDGTILHAIERILPTICISEGHQWQTVYKPGEHW
jgi:lipopolysaccharide biosynthesis protein